MDEPFISYRNFRLRPRRHIDWREVQTIDIQYNLHHQSASSFRYSAHYDKVSHEFLMHVLYLIQAAIAIRHSGPSLLDLWKYRLSLQWKADAGSAIGIAFPPVDLGDRPRVQTSLTVPPQALPKQPYTVVDGRVRWSSDGSSKRRATSTLCSQCSRLLYASGMKHDPLVAVCRPITASFMAGDFDPPCYFTQV